MVALLLAGARPALAQERPRPVLEIAAGAYFFADDVIVTEGLIGGAGRFYVSPRISVGPEIAFIAADSHSHFVATGNVTFDILAGTRGQPPRVTPFLVVGGGIFQTRADFFNRGTFTSTEGAFTAGGGIRGRVGRRVTLGAEARIGWEPHIRVNGFVGIDL